MKKVLNKQSIGFLIGIAVGLIVYLAPLSGINEKAQMDLALSLMTVVWWAFQIAQPAYIGGIYLMLLILTNVATPTQVFAGSWTKSIMWLVMGAYLIAGAVRESGLGERIAYAFIIKFVRSWTGIIVSIFASFRCFSNRGYIAQPLSNCRFWQKRQLCPIFYLHGGSDDHCRDHHDAALSFPLQTNQKSHD